MRESLAQARQSLEEMTDREAHARRQRPQLEGELGMLRDELKGVGCQREQLLERLEQAEIELQQVRAGREREKVERKEVAGALERERREWEHERERMKRDWEERVTAWEGEQKQEREREREVERQRGKKAGEDAKQLEMEVKHLQLEVCLSVGFWFFCLSVCLFACLSVVCSSWK